MTLFQHAAVWTLRASALWAVLELGAALFNQGLDHGNALMRLQGHDNAMARLEQRAAKHETEAQSAEAVLATASANAWRVAAPQVDAPIAALAAAQLREDLLALGAQAPVVDATESPLSGPLRRVHLTIRWRETADAAPTVLHGLAARRGDLKIVSLRLQRDDTLVQVEIEARALVLAEARP